jgi:hypothetical protein
MRGYQGGNAVFRVHLTIDSAGGSPDMGEKAISQARNAISDEQGFGSGGWECLSRFQNLFWRDQCVIAGEPSVRSQ